MTSRVLMALLVIAGLALVMAGTAIGADRPAAQSAIRDGAGFGPSRALAHALLSFTANRGQWPDSILYRAEAEGATLWFTRDGIYYQFFRKIPRAVSAVSEGSLESVLFHEQDSVETAMIKVEFVGASGSVEVVGQGELTCKHNYFIGNDVTEWRTNVPSYSAIELKNLYRGVDLTFRGRAGHLAYDLSVAGGSTAEQVRIAYRGATAIAQADGSVVLQTNLGDKAFLGMLPVAQWDAGPRHDVTAAAAPNGTTLVYSTYLRGAFFAGDIAVDGDGNAYVTGYTSSPNFPTQNAFQTYHARQDVFVAKLAAGGSSLLYATYFGAEGDDCGLGIAVDGSGCAYVTGQTLSDSFPTQNPYQALKGPFYWDAFVTKFSPAGNSLLYSTYLGGTAHDMAYDIAVDSSGNAYVTGYVESLDFPTQGPYQPANNGYDAFVTKLSVTGTSLIYSTYLGGGGADKGSGIAVDRVGNAYVTGHTQDQGFPIKNPFRLTGGDTWDFFVTKFSVSGSSLVYSTFLGGSGQELVWLGKGPAIAVDGAGSAYVTGYTLSTDFPILNAYQTDQPLGDAFVTKFSPAGNSVLYSTYLGGADTDYGRGIAVDAEGCAYVTGGTLSSDFPVLNAFQTDQGDRDVFVTKLDAGGSVLDASTYLGGISQDHGFAVAVDGNGHAYITGETGSTDFPTQDPLYPSLGASVYVTELALGCPITVTGDVNISGSITSADVITLVNYVFKSGLPPNPCVAAGDVNCSGSVTSADVISLVNFVFKGGTPPCDGCTSALAAGC